MLKEKSYPSVTVPLFISFAKIRAQVVLPTPLGPQKRKALLSYFQSIQSIKDASVDDLCKVSGISIKLAKDINIFYKS